MLRGYPEIKNKCLSGFRNLFDKIWHLNLVLGWGAFYCNRTLYEIEMYESRRAEKLLVQRGGKSAKSSGTSRKFQSKVCTWSGNWKKWRCRAVFSCHQLSLGLIELHCERSSNPPPFSRIMEMMYMIKREPEDMGKNGIKPDWAKKVCKLIP